MLMGEYEKVTRQARARLHDIHMNRLLPHVATRHHVDWICM